jgi:hypothetical protein
MSRTITITAAFGAALMLAVPAWGKGQPPDTQTDAVILRTEAQLADALRTVFGRVNQKAPGVFRNRGLDAYPSSTMLINEARRQVSTGDQGEFGAYPASTMLINQARGQVSAGQVATPFRDAHERLPDSARVSTIAPDAFERAVDARGTSSVDRFTANDNRFRVTPVGDPVTVGATGSGTDIEWPQIGIGLGIGIALALGLMLALRVTRHRPLAH